MLSCDEPTVSVVLVCLNARKTIERTLRSIAAEKYQRRELVVVDGGSTDGTLDVLQQYRSIVSSMVSEPDRGISDAFNKGIAMCSGDVVGILGADDVLLPGVMRLVAERWGGEGRPGVVYGDALCIEEGGVVRSSVSGDLSRLAEEYSLRHTSMWVAREAYGRVGGYAVERRLAMDYDWALRAHLAGERFVYVPEVLGMWRSGGVNERRRLAAIMEVRSVSLVHGGRWLDVNVGCAKKVLKYWVRSTLPGAVRQAVVARWRQRQGKVLPVEESTLAGLREYL